MTRHNPGGGYGHYCEYHEHFNYYRIGWCFDRYYAGSRLRYPKRIERDTDESGAKRFCEKWDIEIEER